MAINRLVKEIINLKPEEREKLFRKLGVRTAPKLRINSRLVANSLKAKKECPEDNALNPLGFGIWKNRPELKNPVAWLRETRAREWQR